MIDGASNDRRREIPRIEIYPLFSGTLYHDINIGERAALRTSVAAATGDAVMVHDAKLEYDLQQLSAERPCKP